MIKSIAKAHHMKYVDASEYNQKNLRDVGAGVKYRLVDVAAFSSDGMGLEAGNLGLAAYDISVGFSVGSRQSEAHQFAKLVVGKLAGKWTIHPVPAGRGAFPLEVCRKKAAALEPGKTGIDDSDKSW